VEVLKNIHDIVEDLLVATTHLQSSLDHANAKVNELTALVKELRTNLITKQRALDTRDARITKLRADVAYQKNYTLRYQTDLAEARSLLRKVKH
jgi:chromosome segregation ATPase